MSTPESQAGRPATRGSAARIGLGLAAIGRPAYITTGREADLPRGRSVADLREQAHGLLDAAYAHGIRYVDVARSYGLAEEFLADWLAAHPQANDVVVASKWGYAYVGDWQVDADVHEVKDHSLGAFERQYHETRALLGERLNVYQVHSATLESGILSDAGVHRALAALRERGIRIGLTTSGPAQGEVIRRALDVHVDGLRVFDSIQATWNLLEPSAAGALEQAHSAGCMVIIKEALANGRLTAAGDAGGPGTLLGKAAAEGDTTPDTLALGAALAQPWASIVLSGAATTGQLRSNLAAVPVESPSLGPLAESPATYWSARAARPWR